MLHTILRVRMQCLFRTVNMADESNEEEDSASSVEGDVIEEIDGWMVLEQDPNLRSRSPESSSDEEMDENDRITFDSSLPTTHSYLGEGMEELHGRTIHDADQIVRLPLLLLPGVTLVPGQILPLHLFHPQSVSMMKRVLQADKTFGLLNFSRPFRTQDDNQLIRRQAAKVGTTAEIFSYKEEDEYGVSAIRMKAEGRQRFRVLECKRQLDGVMMGKVKILEDSNMPHIPADSILCHYKTKPNYLSSIVSKEKWIARNLKLDKEKRRSAEQFPQNISKTARTSVSAFPYWVYQQYNPVLLMDLLLEEIRSWNKDLESKNLPTDPCDFSHWLTANLPLDDNLRHSLLEIDCPIVRLRRQLNIMKQCSGLQCAECGHPITDKKELFSMSVRGPLGAYVNPGGYVHETVTFYKANGLRLRGSPSSENSWFPGYAWTIAECEACSLHMGWRFTACTKGLTPAKFWGLTRASLIPQLTSSGS